MIAIDAGARYVSQMADREVRGQLLAAPFVPAGPVTPATPAVYVKLLRCPRCGGDSRRSWTPPFRDPSAAGDAVPDEWPALVMLACEWVTARSVLPLVTIAIRAHGLPGVVVRTRAVAWASRTGSAVEALRGINQAETWADLVIAGADSAGMMSAGPAPVLPAATRSCDGSRHGQWLKPHFLTPHPTEPELIRLNDIYLTRHRAAAMTAF